MVDWERLHSEWDKLPTETKERIAALFKEKTKDKLAELMRKEPMAVYVYEEAVGEPITIAKVRLVVNTTEKPGEYFGSVFYNTFEPTFFGSPNTEALKRTLEEREVEVDKFEELRMAGFEPAQIDEELAAMPWPFSTGTMIICQWRYPEDVEFTEKAKEQWDIYHRVFKREDLELMSVDDLKRILQIKGLSTAGKKEELIDRILGVEVKPPVAPPPTAPPAAPPVEKKPPVPLVPEKGLAKADEKRLLTRFEALLLERSITPGRWRPLFEERLYRWREDYKGLPREEAVKEAFLDVDRLVDEVEGLAKPKAPPVRIPIAPPEIVPAVPPMVIAPEIAPPPGVFRKWGMPWGIFPCPAHLGEGGPPEQATVLRSPYLETRLLRLGLPTHDPTFFELCPYHKKRYGAAFEYFPRDQVEFWLGESVAKAEIDIATLVGMGVSEEYVLYCVSFYEENKKKAVQ